MDVILIHLLFRYLTCQPKKEYRRPELENKYAQMLLYPRTDNDVTSPLKDQLKCVVWTEPSLSGEGGFFRNDSGTSNRNLRRRLVTTTRY